MWTALLEWIMWAARIQAKVFVYAAPISIAVSYVPQIIGLYKAKSAKDISPSFWYIMVLSLYMFFTLAVDGYFHSGTIGLVIAQGVNLIAAVIVMVQVVYYKYFYDDGVYTDEEVLELITTRKGRERYLKNASLLTRDLIVDSKKTISVGNYSNKELIVETRKMVTDLKYLIEIKNYDKKGNEIQSKLTSVLE